MAFESKQSVSESVSESVSKVGIELLGQLKSMKFGQYLNCDASTV